MKTLFRRFCLLSALFCSFLAHAQSYSDIYRFTFYSGFPPTNFDGALPYGGVVFSSNVLYGTCWEAGTNGSGSIYSVHTDGTQFIDLHSFAPLPSLYSGANSDGGLPYNSLILESNVLYGTASQGGSNAGGCVFRLNTDGTHFTNLYSFGYFSGAPMCPLLLISNVLYGTTTTGGAGYGSVFRIDKTGAHFTNLISFYPSVTNIAFASAAGLLYANGLLYGTTEGNSGGNSKAGGTIFSLGLEGRGYSNIVVFQGVGGENQTSTNSTGGAPLSGLTLLNNTLYGVTPKGGTNGNGVIYSLNLDGSGFTVLHTFALNPSNEQGANTNSDGANPECQLLAVGNTLYGVAPNGGIYGSGTLFSIDADGSNFTVHWAFPDIPATNYYNLDGASPVAGLTAVGSVLYGTSLDGGFVDGNVFAFDLSTNITPPNLGFSLSGTTLVLSWDASTYNLQYTSLLGTAFTNLSVSSPYFIGPVLPAAFYRLQHK